MLGILAFFCCHVKRWYIIGMNITEKLKIMIKDHKFIIMQCGAVHISLFVGQHQAIKHA